MTTTLRAALLAALAVGCGGDSPRPPVPPPPRDTSRPPRESTIVVPPPARDTGVVLWIQHEVVQWPSCAIEQQSIKLGWPALSQSWCPQRKYDTLTVYMRLIGRDTVRDEQKGSR